jgi:hypothetical protein
LTHEFITLKYLPINCEVLLFLRFPYFFLNNPKLKTFETDPPRPLCAKINSSGECPPSDRW